MMLPAIAAAAAAAAQQQRKRMNSVSGQGCCGCSWEYGSIYTCARTASSAHSIHRRGCIVGSGRCKNVAIVYTADVPPRAHGVASCCAAGQQQRSFFSWRLLIIVMCVVGGWDRHNYEPSPKLCLQYISSAMCRRLRNKNKP